MIATQVKSIVLAGLSGGSGKSVVSVGLIAALTNRGAKVVPFKKGPDYIDAGWMSKAANSPCYNLDPYLMNSAAVIRTFHSHIVGRTFAVVEGNRGLYDGVNPAGEYSTAELALQLDLPVLLVVNCSKTTRTVAAMVLGCCSFDPRVRFAGVILNQIANARHESIVRQAVEAYTELPVLGIMPRLKQDIFPMRHLGVTPHQEYQAAGEAVARLASLTETHCDMEAIISTMAEVQPLAQTNATNIVPVGAAPVTVGVLRDAAFQFYYEENLEALRHAGAHLVLIDALSAKALPADLDGLYIGGGFPETSARQIADNAGFRRSVREQIDAGLPVYAECGGLIFLGRSLIIEGEEFPLAGVFPVTFTIAAKPQAHGYSAFTVEQTNGFYPVGTQIKGHEFRYSLVHQWDGEPETLAVRMDRGTGFAAGRDGLVKNNALALYTHVMASGTPQWCEGFMRAAREHACRRRAPEGAGSTAQDQPSQQSIF